MNWSYAKIYHPAFTELPEVDFDRSKPTNLCLCRRLVDLRVLAGAIAFALFVGVLMTNLCGNQVLFGKSDKLNNPKYLALWDNPNPPLVSGLETSGS